MTKVKIPNRLRSRCNINSGETLFCWAYSISSMLRQSIIKFLKNYFASKTFNFISQYKANTVIADLNANEFHKRLRDEIVMIPIPKAKFFDSKITNHQRKEEYKDVIMLGHMYII